MAFVQSDLDKLDAAIASGARRVKYADGTEVEYRSLAEMRQVRGTITTALSPIALVTPRVTLATF